MSVPPYPPTGAASPPHDNGSYSPPGGYPAPGSSPAAGGYPPPGGDPASAGVPASGAAFPPPAGSPMAYPPGMIPPPAPVKKDKKRQRLLVAILVVVLAGLAIFAVVRSQKTSTTAADVGACIKVTSATLTDPKTEQAPCTDPAALFVVTETGGSDVKCDVNEPSYVEGRNTDDPQSRVCLRYNLTVGECLDPGATESSVPKKVDCATPTEETAKLVQLRTDTADESQCPADTTPLALAKRNILYCFGTPS